MERARHSNRHHLLQEFDTAMADGTLATSHRPEPGFWDQLLHQPPTKLDTGLHAGGAVLNGGFAAWAIYKLATEKHMKLSSELGYIASLAISLPFLALDLQRLIFAHQHHRGNPKTIQQAIHVSRGNPPAVVARMG